MQNMRLRPIVITVLAAFAITGSVLLLTTFKDQTLPAEVSDDTISIVATIYPMAYFADGLLPDASITTIIEPGVEPHDFSPTLDDVKTMLDADILLIVGGVETPVDAWAMDVWNDRAEAGKSVIVASAFSSHSDPHVWLDPVYSQETVRQIGRTLTVLFPDDREAIEAGVHAKVAVLAGLDAEYQAGLASCEIREIVSAHDAFGYLARRYDFTVHSIAGISPEDEPSASALADLADLIRERKITTVFFEELLSDDLARTLADETGAKIDVLDPIESLTSEYKSQIGYAGIMKENLQKLRSAMVCQ
ncbi:MAG: zinc ABC transporter substrate-binding protein [Patescibacteria group bacterium]